MSWHCGRVGHKDWSITENHTEGTSEECYLLTMPDVLSDGDSIFVLIPKRILKEIASIMEIAGKEIDHGRI